MQFITSNAINNVHDHPALSLSRSSLDVDRIYVRTIQCKNVNAIGLGVWTERAHAKRIDTWNWVQSKFNFRADSNTFLSIQRACRKVKLNIPYRLLAHRYNSPYILRPHHIKFTISNRISFKCHFFCSFLTELARFDIILSVFGREWVCLCKSVHCFIQTKRHHGGECACSVCYALYSLLFVCGDTGSFAAFSALDQIICERYMIKML